MLLGELHLLKEKEWQIEFRQNLDEVKQIAEAEPALPKLLELKDLSSEPFREKLQRIADSAPEASILYAWTAIESELYGACNLAN